MLRELARSFFAAEMSNEREERVSPVTIGSAIRHAQREPHSLLARWLRSNEVTAVSATAAAKLLRAELARLQGEFGNRCRLVELLDMADRDPIRFTCPECGQHELEEIQTDVIVISRVVGRLKNDSLFMYGEREYGTDKTAPYYRCATCKQHVADDDEQMHGILDGPSNRGR